MFVAVPVVVVAAAAAVAIVVAAVTLAVVVVVVAAAAVAVAGVVAGTVGRQTTATAVQRDGGQRQAAQLWSRRQPSSSLGESLIGSEPGPEPELVAVG